MNLLRTTARVIKRGRFAEIPEDNSAAAPPGDSYATEPTVLAARGLSDPDDIDRFVQAAVGMSLAGLDPHQTGGEETRFPDHARREPAPGELQSLRDAAQAEGYAAGWELAQQQAAAEVERLARERAVELARSEFGQVLDSARHLVAQLAGQHAELLNRWEHDLTVLAAQLAERIVQQELARRPAQSATLVREAVALAAGLPVASLRLHPTDLELLTTPGSTRLAGPGCELIADSQLQRGGCVVELAGGEIDARIETRLTRLVDELTSE
jgi:flagellar assembly protein FliH